MSEPHSIRSSYERGILNEEHLLDDPIAMFRHWWHEAIEAHIHEPNAMTLATVDVMNQPSARTVLLKGISDEGLEFYTNYHSRKAMEMHQHPKVALVFYWKELERQIRIEGHAEKTDRQKSKEYFQSRPRGSQISAWASNQSEVIRDRSVLEDEAKRLDEQYKGQDRLPLPDHWGGYLVRPHMFEFWQGRADRLHDRFQYSLEDGHWIIERLAP